MKIIFLDVDGVLNIMSNSYRTFMKPMGSHIEPHLAQRLNYLIEKTKSHVVVSSSWRSDMEDLKKQMVEQGFKYLDKIIDKTPHFLHRGEEIKHWLEHTKENIEAYCVIDDEILDICGVKCRDVMAYYVVQVDMAEGLSQNNIDQAIYILEKGIL